MSQGGPLAGRPEPSTRVVRFAGLAFFLGAFAALWASSGSHGFAIDEATYVWVAREGRDWFADLPELGLARSFSEEELKRRWHFLEPPGARPGQPHSNFNLPVSHHLLNLGWLLGHWFVRDLDAHRMGVWLLFATCVTCVFRSLSSSRGVGVGAFAGLAMLLSPRIFGHAHFAATDTPVACIWMLSLCSLIQLDRARDARERRVAALCFGLAMGLTFGVKLTGWLAAAPAGLWLLVFRPPGWRAALVAASLAVPAILYLATPPLWHDPWRGMSDYLRQAADNPWKITTFYLGDGYQDSLPFTSPLVLLAMMTPASILILACLGAVTGYRDRLTLLFSSSLLTLLFARGMGWMPGHDGERQFLACFYFLCPLAALGLGNPWLWIHRRFHGRRWSSFGRWIARAVPLLVGTLALLEPAVDSWRYRAHGLSYYNRAVGGLPGATSLGMEISYWFEAMTDEAWHHFLDDLPQDSKVFLLPDHPGVDYLIATGIWRPDLKSVGPDEADYFLLYSKRAAYVTRDPESGLLRLTDLDVLRAHAPAEKEIRFLGVRLAALLPTGGARRPTNASLIPSGEAP